MGRGGPVDHFFRRSVKKRSYGVYSSAVEFGASLGDAVGCSQLNIVVGKVVGDSVIRSALEEVINGEFLSRIDDFFQDLASTCIVQVDLFPTKSRKVASEFGHI